MPQKIKLIWDFYGLASTKTAEHHQAHLKQYILVQKMSINITGFEIKSDIHCIAFMVVTANNMIQVRDALKPHRAEVYELK